MVPTENIVASKLTRKDFVTNQEVRWCPGCGDYSILATMQRVLPEIGIPREKFVFVSGIGCSSRFPYYVNTYGLHTIHGRAPTIATGIKATNPDLQVWVVTGDGDGLSIGGNHLLHALRRNVDLKIILFNNKIYGLTKGQYSPTSEKGKRTKSTPQGSIDYPISPLSFALGAEATFVARTVDTNPKHMAEVLTRAAHHKGSALVEVFQNCVIFNNGAYEEVTGKETRDDNTLILENGKPLLFGKDKNKGIQFKDMGAEIVTVGENGVKLENVAIHNENANNSAYAFSLSRFETPNFPVPLGVFRQITKPTYEGMLNAQIEEASSAKKSDLAKLIAGPSPWVVN